MPSDARILIVDDEPKICSMLEVALRRDGYTVHTFADAAAALEQFRAEHYDLVISDLRMPGISGFELIRQIKEARRDTVVLAMTGHATMDTAVQAIREGADDYVTKPLEINALRRVVESSLQNQSLLVHAQEQPRPATEAPGAADAPLAHAPTPAAQPAAPEPTPPPELAQANYELQQRVAELVAVQEIAQAVTGELRLDRMLETCLASVAGATGAHVVSILLAEPDGKHLVVRARHGRNGARAVGERCRIGHSVAGWVAQHRMPLLIADIGEQPGFRALARAEGYRTGSFVAVPLLLHDRLLGVLCATDKGGAEPFDGHDLRLLEGAAAQIAVAVENARLYETLQSNAYNALRALAESFEAKDGFARGHSARVADTAARTAEHLGLPQAEIDTLRQAAYVHDIGKLAVSDTIFARPGALTDDEFAAVQEHPVRGERILDALGFLDAACPIVRHHHERWDGRGYPDGLQGRAIGPLARILTLADAYDAMTSARPHRPAKSRDEAFAEIARCAGAQFDPALIDPFRQAVVALS